MRARRRGAKDGGLVRRTPGMVALLSDLKLSALEVWLTTHRELFTSRRIRAVYDDLGDLLEAHYREDAPALG
jgi:hypothetical protein